ncbi:MAG: pilus assembly protein [Alphaproteobacteria bacterium]|nr:pilus assembly protein [Alphaproteobacteria bacterium]
MAPAGLHRVLSLARRFGPAREGNALIEFAVIAPLLLLLAAGATDFGMQAYAALSVESAARSGMQMLATNPGDTAGAESAALAATSLDPSQVTVTVTQACQCGDGASVSCSGTCATGGDVAISYRVEVSTSYTRIFPYPGLDNPVTLTGRAQIRVR